MRTFKVVIAVALLLCLLPLPYGYYELVRWGGMVCFGVLAYQSYQQKQEGWMVAYAALAILFQPFFKIALGRECGMWWMWLLAVCCYGQYGKKKIKKNSLC